MSDFKHICADSECIYLGQRTAAGMCKCHKTTDQMMREHITALEKALRDLLYANTRVDERPDSLVAAAIYSKAEADAMTLLASVGSETERGK